MCDKLGDIIVSPVEDREVLSYVWLAFDVLVDSTRFWFMVAFCTFSGFASAYSDNSAGEDGIFFKYRAAESAETAWEAFFFDKFKKRDFGSHYFRTHCFRVCDSPGRVYGSVFIDCAVVYACKFCELEDDIRIFAARVANFDRPVCCRYSLQELDCPLYFML